MEVYCISNAAEPHLLQNLFYFWNYTRNIRNLFAPFLTHVFEKQSYHQWKSKWSLKYMQALACPALPPLSDHSLPQGCMKVPNSVLSSLRKFFVCKVFSKNSPQPTFFSTSNIAGFNVSAPATAWIRGERVSFEAWPCKGRPTDAGSPSTQSTDTTEPQGPNHYGTSQKMPRLRNQSSWASQSCLKISL